MELVWLPYMTTGSPSGWLVPDDSNGRGSFIYKKRIDYRVTRILTEYLYFVEAGLTPADYEELCLRFGDYDD